MTHPCDRINAGEHPLKAWREYLGWDLQQIRQETGIRVDKLDKIERGVVRLTKTEAMKIGRAMGIAAINLFPVHVRHERVDILCCRSSVVQVVRVLVHIERQKWEDRKSVV